MEEKKNEYEYAHLRICKHNIQRESCRNCLFEVLCHLEDQKEQRWKQQSTDAPTPQTE